MSDRWWGYIEIENVPASWLREDAERDHFGHQPDKTFGQAQMPTAVWDALMELGVLNEVEFEPYAEDLGTGTGTLTLSDDQLTGGSMRFQEDGLTDALVAAGLPFEGGDDGAYEFPGTFWWWKPGMDAIEERTAAAGTGIVLSEHEARQFISASAGEFDALLKLLQEHFGVAFPVHA
jgi:hypothetical protein